MGENPYFIPLKSTKTSEIMVLIHYLKTGFYRST